MSMAGRRVARRSSRLRDGLGRLIFRSRAALAVAAAFAAACAIGFAASAGLAPG